MFEIPAPPHEPDYSSLIDIGRIEMMLDDNGDLRILVEDFQFADAISCRIHLLRAMAWARDMLDAKIRIEQLTNSNVIAGLG